MEDVVSLELGYGDAVHIGPEREQVSEVARHGSSGILRSFGITFCAMLLKTDETLKSWRSSETTGRRQDP